jgi:hypothetical protein
LNVATKTNDVSGFQRVGIVVNTHVVDKRTVGAVQITQRCLVSIENYCAMGGTDGLGRRQRHVTFDTTTDLCFPFKQFINGIS